MIGSRRRRFLPALLFSLLLAVPAMGDELSSWFASDPRARAYEGVETELEGLIDEARLKKVPIGPLLDKLREGAAKRVDPGRLLDAVGETIDQLARARSVLEQSAGGFSASEEDLQAVSLLLRGLSEELAVELIAFGLEHGREMRAIRAAGDAITRLRAIAELEEGETLKVGTLLLAGKVPVFAYDSLPSIYLKGKASGLSDRMILDEVIIETLDSGGGIIAMHTKIDRIKASKVGRGQRGDRPENPGPDDDRPDLPPQASPSAEPPGLDDDRPDLPPQASPSAEPPGLEKD
jgi:hypothetical protein